MNTTLPLPTDLILVAILPHPRDLEIARLLGWYRVPLRFAPKVVDVDYLAFYQTDAFGREHHWQIEWIAPVRGHELTTRRELFRDEPDHPRANEEYYKISLGALQALPQPVVTNKWKRLTFLYTTGELLQRALTLNDLVVQQEERDVLWRSLRERAMRSAQYQAGQALDLTLDAELLAFLGGLSGLKEQRAGYDRLRKDEP